MIPISNIHSVNQNILMLIKVENVPILIKTKKINKNKSKSKSKRGTSKILSSKMNCMNKSCYKINLGKGKRPN
jgi:hypothetical protein